MFLAAALAAVLLGTGLAYWLNPPPKLPVLGGDEEPLLDSDGQPRVRGLTYTHVENGVRKWTLSAHSARFDEAKGRASLVRVRVEFYPQRGGWIVLTGDEGSYDQKKKLVILQGNVRGRTNDRLTLDTDRLTYSQEREEVDTDSVVTITGPRFRVQGRGMRVDVSRQTLVFKSQVRSTFIPQGNGPPPGVTVEDS